MTLTRNMSDDIPGPAKVAIGNRKSNEFPGGSRIRLRAWNES